MSSHAEQLSFAEPERANRLKVLVPGPAAASRAAQEGLEQVVTRAAVVFRGAWSAVTPLLAFTVGAPATPASIVAVVIVVGWGVTVWLVCRRHRTLAAWLVIADAILYAVLLLAMPAVLPSRLVGDSGGWVFGSATVSILLSAWRLPRWLATSVTAVEMSAYVGGLALAGAPLSSSFMSNLLTYPVQLGIALLVINVMRRSAQAADAALDQLESAYRRSSVDEARLRDRHARRLALHDTVLTTLTAIARGGLARRADIIRRRCRQDLEFLGSTRTRGSREEPVSAQELLARVGREAEARELVASMRSRSPSLVLEADVAVAMVDAAREALSNVERHAGVRTVELEINGDAGKVVMTIADAGVGFDPTSTRPGATGLLHSISGRMEDIGGHATVTAAPSRGTVVTLSWSASSLGHADAFGRQLRRLLAGAYTGGVAKAVVAVALGWHLFSLSMLVSNWHAYRAPSLAVASWLAMLVVGVLLAVGVRRQRVDGGQAAAASIVLVAAALAVIATCSASGLLNHANWVTGGVGWFIAILAVYRRGLEAAVALAVVAAADIVAVAVRFHGALSAVAFMVGILLGIGILQVGAIAIFRILNQNVETAAQAVRTINELEIDRVARAAIIQDRTARDRRLDLDLLPLVRGLAEGSLDPAQAEVRRRCDVAAGILRALITHDDGTSSAASLDAVAAVLEATQARGVVLDLRIDPAIEDLSPAVRGALLSVLTTILATAKAGPGSLTMRSSASSATATVCLPVATPAPELQAEVSAAAAELASAVGRTARTDVEQVGTDRVWIELTWER